MSTDGLYVPICTGCGRELGILDEGEFQALDYDMDDDCFCFDCDPEPAATTPSIFWQWQEGDRFYLGGDWLEYGRSLLGNLRLLAAPAHERKHERDLSSYTKVNRNYKNHVVSVTGKVGYPCRVCDQTGLIKAGRIEVDCEFCGGDGFVTLAIVVPAWILGLGCENV